VKPRGNKKRFNNLGGKNDITTTQRNFFLRKYTYTNSNRLMKSGQEAEYVADYPHWFSEGASKINIFLEQNNRLHKILARKKIESG
jgi:hypothetical protein